MDMEEERTPQQLPDEEVEIEGIGNKNVNGVEEGTASPAKMSSLNAGEKTAKVEIAGDKVVKEEEKPSILRRAWGKLGLDTGTLLMMFKGSVSPTIAIAIYQSDAVASYFGTIGYLIAIITVISIPIMPRAKFLQNLILNILGICVGASITLLGLWSSIQARKHTTPPKPTERYNSSQAAVCAIWLFMNIYLVNCFRGYLPALRFPVIMYSIFTNVAFTFGPLFTTFAQGEALVKQLLTAFLAAFGIATLVNLFIIPVTSRNVVFKELEGYVGLVRKTLGAQSEYLQSLEDSDMFSKSTPAIDATNANKKKGGKKEKSPAIQTPQAKALKGSIDALRGLHGKLYVDLPFGKREIAWGKLDAKDLDEIFNLLRGIFIPIIGLGTITDIFERIAERRGWANTENAQYDEAGIQTHTNHEAKEREKRVWNEMMKTLHEPFAVVVAAMDEGIQHAALLLEITPTPKNKKEEDVESKSADPKPGDLEFSKYLSKKLNEFYASRGHTLKAWARDRGLSEEQFDSVDDADSERTVDVDDTQHSRDQQQLYMILYMEFLLYSVGLAIAKLINYAEKKVEDGTMKKNRLILPGGKRLKKWLFSLGKEDTSIDNDSSDRVEASSQNIYMGAGFNAKKDPEHLPPQTVWQHFGNRLRTVPRFFGSPESAFGFRVACATMSIGIVAFLKETQVFFTEQRLVWAMIIIAIGMTMTSGQSIFGFFGRVAGTAISMVISIVIWYIVDQKVPGVIVFLWFFIFIEMYFFLKFPRWIAVWIVCIVTQVLIVGYELQVKKIGVAASTKTGQGYYPVYELAPYRLACVAGGSFVAFIWTVFPYPISDRSWLRRDLGCTLYILANFHAIVHSTINARMKDAEGDIESKDSVGRKLEKIRHKTFGKLLILLPSLQEHANWEKWEPTIGGKFPKESYENIILRATNIMSYLSLAGYATLSWSKEDPASYPNTMPASRRAWLKDLNVLIDRIGPTSHSVTSTLSLLSASVIQGCALPPYLQLPGPFNLSKRLEALDKGILDARHIEEPGYAAYAVMQVASSLITDDLRSLVDSVRALVGETDFSFRVEEEDGGEVGKGYGVKRD